MPALPAHHLTLKPGLPSFPSKPSRPAGPWKQERGISTCWCGSPRRWEAWPNPSILSTPPLTPTPAHTHTGAHTHMHHTHVHASHTSATLKGHTLT